MQLASLPPIHFGAPQYLPLLAIPAALLLLWLRLAWRRRVDVAALRGRRVMPVRERIPFLGELLFWLCLTAALAFTLLAIARPQTTTSIIRTAGVDFVILQDGSASMHVADVGIGILSMHSPMDISAKVDLWELYRGFKVFLGASAASPTPQ